MPLTAFPSLNQLPAAQWDALAPVGQPFLSHAFLAVLEESGSIGPGTGWRAEHLVWMENGRPLAAIPGYRKSHSYGEYVFDHGWADACRRARIPYYPKWLGAVPFSPVSGPRLLGAPDAAAQLLAALPGYLEQQRLSGAHINFTAATDNGAPQAEAGWVQPPGVPIPLA